MSTENEDKQSGCCSTPSTSVPEMPGIEIKIDSISADGNATASCCAPEKPKSGFSQLFSRLQSAWTVIMLIPLLVLIFDSQQIQEMLTIAFTALSGTAPFIVFAVLLIAYLKATSAESIVAKAFEGRENRMIVLAALFGGLAPFCSCEVIPFVAGLLAVGAPLSAVMAFWLSSPLIDPPSLLITAGALGWEFAVGKAAAAVFLGLFGGFAIKLFLQSGAFSSPLKNAPTSCCSSDECGTGIAKDKAVWKFWTNDSRRKTFGEEAKNNAYFLFKWLTLAYMLEAILILYVPASLIGSIVGGEGVTPVVLGALVGMPAYLNSYAAPPLVAGLMEQGMSIGSAMAFMVAGAISSIPAMTAVYSLVKPPVFAAYLIFGVMGAVLFSLGFAAVIG